MIELSQNIANYLESLYNKEFVENYKKYIESYPNQYIRIDPNTDHNNLILRLQKYGIELEQAQLPFAYKVIKGSDKVGKTLEFTLGMYYVQSLSSMIPPFILNPSENDITLDLCAAPGSKTTQLAELMNRRGTLIANEVNQQRVGSLNFNVDKMNLSNIGVMKQKGELISKTFDNYFDKILVDAPCSALGIVQKKNEVSNWWNLEQAEKIAEVQFKLLVSAVKAAKVGAEIIYSTCTLTIEENEFVLDKILKKYPVEIEEFDLPLKHVNGFTKFGEYENQNLALSKRIIPWENDSEGFFVAKLRKTDSTEPLEKTKYSKSQRLFFSANHRNIKPYLKQLHEYFGIDETVLNQYKYIQNKSDLLYVNSDWLVEDSSYFLKLGLKLGVIDRKDKLNIHSDAARTFGKFATKNKIILESKEDLTIYLNGSIIKKSFDSIGQKIVEFEEMILGSAVQTNEGLKSQFPRNLRTNEIILP